MKYELTENEGLALINLGLTGIGAVERILRDFRAWEDTREQIRYEREMQERERQEVREACFLKEQHDRAADLVRVRQEAKDARVASELPYRCLTCGEVRPNNNVPCAMCAVCYPNANRFESDYERAGFTAKVLTPEEQFSRADWHDPSYLRPGPAVAVSAVRGMATPPSAPPPIPPTGPLVGDWHAPPTGSFPPTMHTNAPIPGGGKIPDPEVSSPSSIPMVAISEERLTMGRLAFIRLLGVWDQGFRENVPQPDRSRAMADIANGSVAYPVLRVVHDAGGLSHAVAQYLAASHVDIPAYVAETYGFERRVLSLTDNLVQVASLIFPDLAALYEHRNIFPDVVPDTPFFSNTLSFSDTGPLPVTVPEAT